MNIIPGNVNMEMQSQLSEEIGSFIARITQLQ